jgi:hypothetical protein
MLSVIEFLEDAGSRPFTAAEFSANVALLDVDKPVRDALLERDQVALNDLLGGRPAMFFGVCAPDEEPQPEEDEPLEDEPIQLPE